MPANLFDLQLRALRRDRAFRLGAELFMHQRAFDDCLERIGLVNRRFQSALLIGCPDPRWRERLLSVADAVHVTEPGAEFARAAGAEHVVDESQTPPGQFDLCLAAGTLDTANDLPGVLRKLAGMLQRDSLVIGAMPGGDTLPQLRRAMLAADQVAGAASPHAHPRIEAASLAALIASCGFIDPVVDVDRVPVSYRSLNALVSDLRRMAATNILIDRSRSHLSRQAAAAASAAFASSGDGERTIERFEILHFAGWTAAAAE